MGFVLKMGINEENPDNEYRFSAGNNGGGGGGGGGADLPPGGTTGQVLTKKTDADYDTEWKTPNGGGIEPPISDGLVLTSGPDGLYGWDVLTSYFPKDEGYINNSFHFETTTTTLATRIYHFPADDLISKLSEQGLYAFHIVIEMDGVEHFSGCLISNFMGDIHVLGTPSFVSDRSNDDHFNQLMLEIRDNELYLLGVSFGRYQPGTTIGNIRYELKQIVRYV